MQALKPLTSYSAPSNTLITPSSVPTQLPPENLWQTITTQYSISQQQHPRIQQELLWLQQHPTFLSTTQYNAQLYMQYVYAEIQKRQFPSELTLLPIIESTYNPFAYSSGKASGLWQIMSATGKELGLTQNWWFDGRRDIQHSTQAALRYLGQLNKRYKGDWLLTLAAYNAGYGTVNRAIHRNKKQHRPTDFWSLDLPKETQRYVPKLLALAKHLQNTLKHMTPINNEPFFTEIPLDQPIDFALASSLSNEHIDLLYHLNAGHKRWLTAFNTPHSILLPVRARKTFMTELAKHKKPDLVTFKRHIIQRGDTLSSIASKYQTHVQMIQASNSLPNARLRINQTLRIPIPNQPPNFYALSDNERHKPGAKQARRMIYTIRSGDSLWKIARRHQVNVKSLLAWNNLHNTHLIKPGRKLVIWPARLKHRQPVDYTVRKGDSLARISKKFRVPITSLRRWNTLRKGKTLYPGQQLRVYLKI